MAPLRRGVAMIGLSEIYDAAFDRRRFPAMLERLALAFGAQSAFVRWSDADLEVGFQAQFGSDPVWLQRYVDTYAQHDILRPVLHGTPEGECVRVHPYLQHPEIRESPFYREYLVPQGIVDNLAVNFIKRRGIVAHLALLRFAPAAPFDKTDCARLSAIVPHLRRAIYIQSHLARAADHAAGLKAAGGATSAGLLLDAAHRVIEIDPFLGRLLGLRTGDPLGHGAFATVVASAIDNKTPIAVAVSSGADNIPLLCEARTLEQQRFGDLASGPSASHVIYVTRLDQPRTIAFDAMAALYRLTPTELKVLRDALEHGDLAGIGGRLGMAAPTARTHLHRIYEKTATRSFAGLSNLAHRFGQIELG